MWGRRAEIWPCVWALVVCIPPDWPLCEPCRVDGSLEKERKFESDTDRLDWLFFLAISRKTKAALWVVTMSTSLKSSKSAAKTKDFSLHNACMVAWISRHKGKAWLLAKHVARRQDERINISHVCGLNMKLQSADGSELTVKAAHCRRHWVSILSGKVPKP